MPSQKVVPNILNSIIVNNTKIQRTTTCKYLGILLDDKLKFNDHIQHLSSNLARTISAFKIIKHSVPENQKLKLYYAYFHSKLQYALEIYGSAAKKYLKQVQVLQHRALKTLFNLDPLTPSKQILHMYRILSVHDLYKLRISKFMHKQRFHKLPNIFADYSSLVGQNNHPNTRNRNKLKVPRVRTEAGKKAMKYTGVKIWNDLLDKFNNVIEESECLFTKRVKHHYLSGYLSDEI
jgi:hypothetical protein